MFRRTALIFAMLGVSLVLLSSTLGADTLYTLKSHTDAFEVQGHKQPAEDTDITVWVAGDKLRRDQGGQSMIFRPDKSRFYILDHEDKTYSELPLPIDLRKLMPPGNEALADQIAASMKVTVQVTPKTETRQVGQWNAKRYDVSVQSAMGMKIATTLWVSRDVEGFQSFNRLSATMASLQPGSEAWVQELQKIDGFPVLQESKVDALGAKFGTREELVAIETKAAPAGAFDLPAAYKAKPYNPIAGMSR